MPRTLSKVNWCSFTRLCSSVSVQLTSIWAIPSFTLVLDYKVFQTLKRSGTWWHVSLLLSVPCFFWESLMKSKQYGPLLQFASSGMFSLLLGWRSVLQTFISQDTREMCFELLQIMRHFWWPVSIQLQNASLWVLKVLLAAKECSCLSVVCLWLFLSILQWFHYDENVRFGVFLFFSFVILTVYSTEKLIVRLLRRQTIDDDQPASNDESIPVPFKKLFRTEPKYLVLCIGLLIAGINSIYLQASWKSLFLFLTGHKYRGNMKPGTTLCLLHCGSFSLFLWWPNHPIPRQNLMGWPLDPPLIIRTLCFTHDTSITTKLVHPKFRQDSFSGLFWFSGCSFRFWIVAGSNSALWLSVFLHRS